MRILSGVMSLRENCVSQAETSPSDIAVASSSLATRADDYSMIYQHECTKIRFS
jgi:hypothetical protein